MRGLSVEDHKTLGPQHSAVFRNHRTARVAGLVALATVTFVGSGAAFWLHHMRSNMTTLDSVAHLVAPPTSSSAEEEATADDPLAGGPVNLLVLGSDDRSGENAAIAGEDPGGGSDTTLIVHLSADRSRVEVVSIPRDSRAEIPACHLDWQPDGEMSEPRTAKFNAAFAIGWETGDPALAAACTQSTVQTMTGLTINGFVIVDMAGFEGMVDAVGSVRICAPEPLRDLEYTGLDLTAGWHDLGGAQALQYVRARHIEGSDGMDTSRIERQQTFIGALLRKVLSSDVLTSPLALSGFLDAATSSLAISAELGEAQTLLGLAWGLRGLDSADITFLTVPWVVADHGYVDWTEDASLLWSRLVDDQPVNPTPVVVTPGPAPTTPGATDPGQPAPVPVPTGPTSTEPVPAEPDFEVRTADDPDEALCG